MAKPVGLSRKITLKWLNKAVDLLSENLSEEDYKAKIDTLTISLNVIRASSNNQTSKDLRI